MCDFIVDATTKLHSNNSNNNNNYKKDCVIDNCIENVCRLVFLFLLFFLMCNFVFATTKLHINNNNKNNNNNVKITLHKCPDHLLTMSTWCSTALGHQMPLLGQYVWLSTAFSITFLNMSSWHYIVLLLTTRWLYQGEHLNLQIWTHFVFHALLLRGLFYERSIKQDKIQQPTTKLMVIKQLSCCASYLSK